MKNKITIQERASGSLFFLSFKDLCVTLGQRSIFSNISFNVSYNNILLIKGPVGSGKSTLLKILAGFIKIKSGVFSHTENNVPIKCVYVHSQPEFNFITGYVNDEVILSGANSELFTEFFGKSVYDMSGGQLKKLSIMIAISAYKDCVLLLDEPFDMLDDQQADNMAKFILTESKTRPFIIATHDGYFDNIADAIINID